MKFVMIGLTAALLSLLTFKQVYSEVYYFADFEDGNPPALYLPFVNYRGKIDMVSREDGEPTYKNSEYSFRIAGTNIWNWVELQLDTPVQLNQPVYLVCAIRGDGAAGEVRLGMKLAGHSKSFFSTTGPIGRESIGGWQRIVARLDHYGLDLANEKLIGIRLSQRCAPGKELPWRTAPYHELLIDDVRIVTASGNGEGVEVAKAIEAAMEEAGVVEYEGPHKFMLQNKDDFAVWHSPSTVPVLKESSLPINNDDKISITAAQREAESFQVVITPDQPGRFTLGLRSSHLTGPGESQISLKNVALYPVRYVHLRSRLGNSIEMDWPDPLSKDSETQVDTAENVPFWVTVNVPASAVPGLYRGMLTVFVTGDVTRSINIPLEVKVLAFQLPHSPSFKTNQQLWEVSRDQAKPWLAALAQRKMYDANMWYSGLEEQKWRIEELGQNCIKVNMVGGHGMEPVTLDGNEIYTAEYETIFLQRLSKQVKWLTDNGWNDKSFIYIWDENWGDYGVLDMVTYLVGLTRQVTAEIPVLAALPLYPQTEDVIDIYLSDYSQPEDITRRIKYGDEFWRWGNVDLELGKAPLSVRLSYGFEALEMGCKGAYSWSVSAWRNRDPWSDFDQKNWVGSLFYPGNHIGSTPEGPVPSIRLELLRDGVEDFEYITILQHRVQGKGQEIAKQADDLINKALQLSTSNTQEMRCNENIDELFDVRKELQEMIVQIGDE